MHFSIPPLFVLMSLGVIVSPGPDILYVLSKGIAHGTRPALIAALGFACGLSVHTSLAAVGLSALLMASTIAFTMVKLSGAAYLFYLGIKAFGSHRLVSVQPGGQGSGGWLIFRQAFVMNVLNPKVITFFLAFLSQFTRPELGKLWSQLLILGGCFALLALALFSLVGIFSSMLGPFILARPRFIRALDYLAGSFFMLIAIRLILTGNQPPPV
ncbi:MAG: lysine transporter LysE [Chthoniobacteraceae bacterium]|nr:lysine transporter LysE [Chthoniobacteraceae bacterium]